MKCLWSRAIIALALVPLLLQPVGGGDWSMMVPAAPKDLTTNETIVGGGVACQIGAVGDFSLQQKNAQGAWEVRGTRQTVAFEIFMSVKWAESLIPAIDNPNGFWPLSEWPPSPPPPIGRKKDYKVVIFHNNLEIARVDFRVAS